MLSKEEILKKIQAVPFWGQSIPLPYGIVTPGKVMNNLETFNILNLPQDLSGKRVLDIGCWDGFYSFECEKRGASVLAIDSLERMKRPDEKQYASEGNAGFETVKEILGSNVEFRNMSVYDISPEEVGYFDIVLFLGVLYHLKYPLLAIEKISAVTKEAVFIESAALRTFSKMPLARYAESDSFNQDPTNWFIPNVECIEAMLRDAGFKRTEVLLKPAFLKNIIDSLRTLSILSYGRCIVKGYK